MKDDIILAKELAVRDLQLQTGDQVSISGYDKLVAWLAGEIQILLNDDFEKLLNLLYRIDVSEQKAGEALSSGDPAMALARLVIERELQKVETRKKYR